MGFTAGAIMWEALGGAAKDCSGECGVERYPRARGHVESQQKGVPEHRVVTGSCVMQSTTASLWSGSLHFC